MKLILIAFVSIILIALVITPVMANKEPVDWDTPDFKIHFESGSGIVLQNASFLENGIPVPAITFQTNNLSTFGQVSVKQYDREQSTSFLNNASIKEVNTRYGVSTSRNIYYSGNGQNITAVTHSLIEKNGERRNVTQAGIGFGNIVVILIMDDEHFEDVLKTLTLQRF